MIKKLDNCIYCGEKMESITAKKKFCSPLHRLNYFREKKRGTLDLPKIGAEILNGNAIITERKQHNHSMTLTVTPKSIPLDNSEIQKQIDVIRAEVKPSFVDKSRFEKYQEKKITELKKQLK